MKPKYPKLTLTNIPMAKSEFAMIDGEEFAKKHNLNDEIYIGYDEHGNEVEYVKVLSGKVDRDLPSFVKDCGCSICDKHKTMSDDWVKASIEKANENKK